ncbi:DMT family transporter [Polycladidibacter hongkongensis]|uniref:DMT family transporter n=1 Tax=Polycladidibacter hongkongensis TaxID=1647556 RepID=UPI000830579F|nr:DMT family transporter [Pseudovibrio hongkongensis]
MSRALANLLLLTSGLIWGMAFVTQSTAMENLGALQFTGIRFLLACIAVAPLAWYEARKPKAQPLRKSSYLPLLGVGLCFTLGCILQQYGIIITSVTNAGFLTAVYVVLTPFLAWLLFKEQVNPLVWCASGLTLFGIFLLGGGSLTALNAGDLLMLACAVFWALQVIFVGRLGKSIGRPVAIALSQFLTVGILCTIAGFILEPISWSAINAVWFELFFAGVCSGGVAFTIQAFAQQWTKPADAAIMLSSEALFAALFAAVLLGERLNVMSGIGAALIFSSILLVELAPHLRAKLRPSHPG